MPQAAGTQWSYTHCMPGNSCPSCPNTNRVINNIPENQHTWKQKTRELHTVVVRNPVYGHIVPIGNKPINVKILAL